MIRLTEAQRTLVTDKVPDLANLAAGALIFGQFLAERPFSLTVALLGIALWIFFMGCAGVVAGGGKP